MASITTLFSVSKYSVQWAQDGRPKSRLSSRSRADDFVKNIDASEMSEIETVEDDFGAPGARGLSDGTLEHDFTAPTGSAQGPATGVPPPAAPAGSQYSPVPPHYAEGSSPAPPPAYAQEGSDTVGRDSELVYGEAVQQDDEVKKARLRGISSGDEGENFGASRSAGEEDDLLRPSSRSGADDEDDLTQVSGATLTPRQPEGYDSSVGADRSGSADFRPRAPEDDESADLSPPRDSDLHKLSGASGMFDEDRAGEDTGRLYASEQAQPDGEVQNTGPYAMSREAPQSQMGPGSQQMVDSRMSQSGAGYLSQQPSASQMDMKRDSGSQFCLIKCLMFGF